MRVRASLAVGALIVAALALRAAVGHRDTGTRAASFRFDGRHRSYLFHLPAGKPRGGLPLVIVLHGAGGQGRGMERLSGLSPVADREGFAVAYPDGIWRQWNDGRGKIAFPRTDDVGFLLAMVDHLTSDGTVDPHRVYVAGISNGGMMAQRLACEASDRIAAVTSVAATLPEKIEHECQPQRPVSMLFMHGTKDPLVPYRGGMITSPHGMPTGSRVLSLDATARFWAERNGCAASPESSALPDRAEDNLTVRVSRYGSCRDHVSVEAYTINGGGHTWPGGLQYLPAFVIGRTSRNLDADETIWQFFKRASR
ncbi:MAG TPA: PHB depolymerase family esterase [Bryobacteraceae bacterium]|nr:PHB depolymerase family esterase [Bryobacteraceae bacterium]